MPADKAHRFKYTAFLSYSHRDTPRARRIHRTLERFRIDEHLASGATPLGPDPKSLRPIFRDREEFSAGKSLDEQTREALEASAFMILLCSPSAAKSEYVNQEVLLFKKLGRSADIIPVILEGMPDGGEDECFPPAMRHRVTAKGTVTSQKEDIIAADIRSSGDGWELTIAKVVARLIGVGTDAVFARAERERRRIARIRTMVISLIAVLTVGGALFAYQAHNQRRTLSEIEDLVSKYSLVTPAEGATTTSTEGLTDAITAIVSGAARDSRYALALQHLKDGDAEQAEVLLRQLAEETARRANQEGKRAADAYRRLGAIAGLADQKRARNAYAKALQFDPTDSEALYWHGWLSLLAGNLLEAERDLKKLLEVSTRTNDSRGVFRAHLRLGELTREKGDLEGALTEQMLAFKIARQRAEAEPGEAERQRDLSVLCEKLGDIFYAKGNIDNALLYFRKSLEISERLAKSDPSNVRWKRDLSVLSERVGDVHFTKGEPDEALVSYRKSAAIRSRLAELAPENESWQRDYSVALERIGDALSSKNKSTEALASYRESLAISKKLAKGDTENSGLQLDLSVSTTKVGDVLLRLGKLDEALSRYSDSLSICQQLVKDNPFNPNWKRALSVAHIKVADVMAAKGKLVESMGVYKKALEIRANLAESDPSNAFWQRDLAVSYSKLADAHSLAKEKNLALDALRKGHDIIQKLLELAPDNAVWKRDLAWFDRQISEIDQ